MLNKFSNISCYGELPFRSRRKFRIFTYMKDCGYYIVYDISILKWVNKKVGDV